MENLTVIPVCRHRSITQLLKCEDVESLEDNCVSCPVLTESEQLF